MSNITIQNLQKDIQHWFSEACQIERIDTDEILDTIKAQVANVSDPESVEFAVQLSRALDLVTKIPQQDALRLDTIQALANQSKIEQDEDILRKIKQDIQDLYAEMQKSQQLLKRCAVLVANVKKPEYRSHWLELANVILERKDAYGFEGIIDHRDAHTKLTPGTGLEGQSVAYGAFLQPNELVRYTLPGTKLHIEHHASGKIIDNSTYNDKTDNLPEEQERNIAALKCAKLLLMDCVRRQEDTIFISGPPHSVYQAHRVFTALQILATEAGHPVSARINVPGWSPDLFPAPEQQKLEASLSGLFADAKDEFTDLYKSRLSKVIHGAVLISPPDADLTVSTQPSDETLEIKRSP